MSATVNLTPWQRTALYRLHLAAGPRSSSHLTTSRSREAVITRLVNLGLVDEVPGAAWPLYALTDAGRAEAARRWPEAA